ncbi:MAG: hypothetical protein EOO90_17840 [Pedobacter sp.]|nr:MAG: hypothetical protein EOO90_17840 [Pedobacter sp.]
MKSKTSILILTCISIISCAFYQRPEFDEFVAIEVTFVIKTDQPEFNKMIGKGNCVKIISFEDMRIFNVIKTHEISKEEVMRKDTVNEFYVVNNGEKKGIFYSFDSLARKKTGSFDLDTLLKYKGLDKQNLAINQLDLGKPFETKNYGNLRIEKYVVKKTKDTDPDTIYRHYDSALKNVAFSLSDSLDRASNSKLCKTVIIHNKSVPVSDVADVAPRIVEVSWSLEKINIKNKVDLLKAFELFSLEKKKQLPK